MRLRPARSAETSLVTRLRIATGEHCLCLIVVHAHYMLALLRSSSLQIRPSPASIPRLVSLWASSRVNRFMLKWACWILQTLGWCCWSIPAQPLAKLHIPAGWSFMMGVFTNWTNPQMIRVAPCVTLHWTISHYFSCPSRRAAQLLPSPNSHHIRRIIVSSFLSPFSENPASFSKDFPPEDPEVHSHWTSEDVMSQWLGFWLTTGQVIFKELLKLLSRLCCLGC